MLHVAILSGHHEMVEKILKKGGNPNSVDRKGNTGLHAAFISDRDKIIDILIGFGANQQITNNAGKTPWNYLSPG